MWHEHKSAVGLIQYWNGKFPDLIREVCTGQPVPRVGASCYAQSERPCGCTELLLVQFIHIVGILNNLAFLSTSRNAIQMLPADLDRLSIGHNCGAAALSGMQGYVSMLNYRRALLCGNCGALTSEAGLTPTPPPLQLPSQNSKLEHSLLSVRQQPRNTRTQKLSYLKWQQKLANSEYHA